MAGDLDGKLAVITAAASGMGRDAAFLFADEGAHVVLIDLDGDAASAAVDEIKAAGGSAQALTVDMTYLAQIDEAVAAVGDEHGRIDVLYNHAGAAGPRGFDFDEAVWDFQVNLNLRSSV